MQQMHHQKSTVTLISMLLIVSSGKSLESPTKTLSCMEDRSDRAHPVTLLPAVHPNQEKDAKTDRSED